MESTLINRMNYLDNKFIIEFVVKRIYICVMPSYFSHVQRYPFLLHVVVVAVLGHSHLLHPRPLQGLLSTATSKEPLFVWI